MLSRKFGAERVLFGGGVAVAAFGVAMIMASGPSPAQRDDRQTLRPASAFAGIKDAQARAVAIFQEMGKVLQHPRCMNCHPRGDIPRQGDKGAFHRPPVVRGADNFGAPGMRCGTCHGVRNFEPARVPGAPKWHLAPVSMGWQGLTLGAICRQIKDRKRNGDHPLAEIILHLQKDPLVGWAWNPGANRVPAPGTWAQFGALAAAWAAAGAHCPE